MSGRRERALSGEYGFAEGRLCGLAKSFVRRGKWYAGGWSACYEKGMVFVTRNRVGKIRSCGVCWSGLHRTCATARCPKPRRLHLNSGL